jgi:hypothetical protein
MGNQNKNVSLSLVSADEAEAAAGAAAAELAVALGLVRVLTLLRFHDPALDEVEQRLATVWEALLGLRRLLAEDEASRHQRGEGR